MNAVEPALRDFLDGRPHDVAIAGLAVSVSARTEPNRTEPRFTRDLNFAVSVANDEDTEGYVLRMRQLGYEIEATLQQTTQQRLSTIRLRRRGRGPLVDLRFATCGIEAEIVQAACSMEVVRGLVADVAQVGHLIAMKLVLRDATTRPQNGGARAIRAAPR